MHNRIETKDGDVAEYFSTLTEMRRVIPTRRCFQPSESYLSDEGNARGKRSFNGFETREELKDLMDGGAKDISAVQGVAAFAHLSKPTCAKTRLKVRSVVNGEFKMGRYLAGNMDCFVKNKRITQPTTKVIKIMVNMSVNCMTTPKEIDDACKVISRNIVALEKSRVRVRLTACCTGEWTYKHREKVSVCAVTLKEPEQPLNFRKLLFGLSTTFFRGPLFHWLACEAGCPGSLGHPVRSESRLMPLLKQVMNCDDIHYFGIGDIIEMNQRNRNDLEKTVTQIAEKIKV